MAIAQPGEQLVVLNGLRGLAAMAVLLHHIAVVTQRSFPFGKGYLAVDFFFVRGAEVDIIVGLLENAHANARAIPEASLIDLDAIKIPGRAHRVVEVRQNLEEEGISYLTPPQCQYGMVTNHGAVRNYLLVSGAKTPGVVPFVRSFFYNLGLMWNREANGYHKMRLLKAFPVLRVFAKSSASV